MNQAARPLVPARYFLLLGDVLAAAGFSLDELVSAAGFDPCQFRKPDFTVTAEQVDNLIVHALKMTGRSDLGFDWGRRLKLSSHDLLGYAMLSCTTIDQLFRLTARYYGLIAPIFRMEYQRIGGRAVIIYRPAVPMRSETLHLVLEVIAVSTHFQCSPLLTNTQSPYDIYMSMEEPPHVHRYREISPARVHFAASSLPELRIVADTWSLDAPLPMADEHAVKMAEERCKPLLQRYREQGNWTDWVVMMLNEAEDSQPTLNELAGIIGMSGRTLERYLTQESRGFRSIAIHVRNERALRLLREGDMPISQIAYRLGFTDLANFTRAFRRENGVSPSDFRRGGSFR